MRIKPTKQSVFLSLFLITAFFCSTTKADVLWVGQSKTCSVTIMGINQYNVNWNVSGGYITLTGGTWATKTATVTQFFSGEATITCSYQYQLYYNGPLQNHTQTWSISCQDNPLYIVPTYMNLETGQSGSISPHLTYINQYNQYATYSFSSLDISVATVSNSGFVTAVGDGITNIIVFCNASQNSCVCIVSVSQSPTSVSIPDSLSLTIGESSTIVPVLYPSNASTTFTWHSDNESVATVSSEGIVTGVSPGTTEISCTTHNGIVSNSCHVSVDWKSPEIIDITEDTCFIMQGEYLTVNCNIYPTGANPNVIWASRDEWIAPVNNNGLVAGYHIGSTYIVASSVNGLQDSCLVKVCQPAEAIHIRDNVSLAIGSQYKYYVSFIPENGFANDLQWISDDTNIVEVDNGTITGMGLGSSKIRVFNNDGLFAESEVYVKEMNQINVWLQSGDLFSFPLEFSPVLTYQSDSVHIDCWFLSASFSISDVLKITIADSSEPWYEPICYAPQDFDGISYYNGETGTQGAFFTWNPPQEIPSHYNLYRDEIVKGTREVIEIDGNASCYTDETGIGNYMYRLTAVHEDCESDFAMTVSGENYILIEVSSLGENQDEEIVTILNVFNISGQKIPVTKLENLNPGAYVVQGLTNQGRVISRKLIIEHTNRSKY